MAALPEFGAVLATLDERGLRRRRRGVRRLAHDTAEIELDGRRCIDFCSNDYLGLSAHPRVTEALVAAAREHGVGARASHLISGHQGEHEALEEELGERTVGFRIEDEDLEDLKTVRDAVDYVVAKLG